MHQTGFRHRGDYDITHAECSAVSVCIVGEDGHHENLRTNLEAEQERFRNGEAGANLHLTSDFQSALVHALRTSKYDLARLGLGQRFNGTPPPQTRIVFRNGAGLDLVDRAVIAETIGAWWCNVHEASPEAVSLRAFQGFTNYLTRWNNQRDAFDEIPVGGKFPRKHPAFQKDVQPIDPLSHSFAIIGHGRIGNAVLLRMLRDYPDMQYYIIDPNPRVPVPEGENIKHVPYKQRLEILRRVLGATLHVNGEAGKIFSKEELLALGSSLRRTNAGLVPPYLGSFGRGKSVDNDLTALLVEAGMLHADFDVLEDESKTSALAKIIAQNRSLTPHIGGSMPGAERENAGTTARYIRDWIHRGMFNPLDDLRDLPFGKIDVPIPTDFTGARTFLTVKTDFRDACRAMLQSHTDHVVRAFTTPDEAVEQQHGGRISTLLADIPLETNKAPDVVIDLLRQHSHDILSYRLMMLEPAHRTLHHYRFDEAHLLTSSPTAPLSPPRGSRASR